jgi:NDP-sugar pyrophosphorylase family protein
MIRVVRTAFVLGAGLGTRLRPLTNRRPKPLIPVANRPLIGYAFDRLRAADIANFVVNTHWSPEAYARVFPDNSYRDASLVFRHETAEILDTAGGMKNVEDLLGDGPFIVHNGDILTDLPLLRALAYHVASGNEVTLVLRSDGGPLQVAFDDLSGRILDIGRRLDSAREPRHLFTGIYVVQPAFLGRIPRATRISVIPIFCDMIRGGAKLGGIVVDDGYWFDLGTREQYLAVHRHLQNGPWISETADVSSSALVLGATAVGARARIGDGARLQDCLIWEDSEVAPGAILERCIVTDGSCAKGTHSDRDFLSTP